MPVSSHWSFRVVLVTNKDGKPRFCVEGGELKQKMKADRRHIPKIQEIFDKLAVGEVFSTLDLFSGCWKIRVDENCKEMTTLVFLSGTFQLEVVTLGLMNVPSNFQRMMDRILMDLEFVRTYLDDAVVFNCNIKKNWNNILQVF